MQTDLRVAIASGKGGTGKTTLATALAITVASQVAEPVTLADCDVEQPNLRLFFAHDAPVSAPVWVAAPDLDASRCTGCQACANHCRFNALAIVKDRPMWFEQLCHGCGACWLSCEHGGIQRGRRQVGTTSQATTQHPGLRLIWGELTPGQPLAPPVIKSVKELATDAGGLAILDAPPGTSCPLVETLRNVHCCLLVTEPTPFGLHDLRLAVQVTRVLKVPAALIINRTGIGDRGPVVDFAAREGLSVLLEVPFSRHIAAVLAQGGTLLDAGAEWRDKLAHLWHNIAQVASETCDSVSLGGMR